MADYQNTPNDSRLLTPTQFPIVAIRLAWNHDSVTTLHAFQNDIEVKRRFTSAFTVPDYIVKNAVISIRDGVLRITGDRYKTQFHMGDDDLFDFRGGLQTHRDYSKFVKEFNVEDSDWKTYHNKSLLLFLRKEIPYIERGTYVSRETSRQEDSYFSNFKVHVL